MVVVLLEEGISEARMKDWKDSGGRLSIDGHIYDVYILTR